jgi:hypothetical protein
VGYLLTRAWAWVVANPIETAALVLYLVANVVPRPHPEKLVGWRLLLWGSLDRLCFLSAKRVPGSFKALFGASPIVEPPPPPPARTEDSNSGTMVKP